MLLDNSGIGGPRGDKPNWPGDKMWTPGDKCKQLQHPCRGTAYGKGEACNECGMFADGSYDTSSSK